MSFLASPKFQGYFPWKGDIPRHASNDLCPSTLQQYLWNATNIGLHKSSTITACYHHEECMFHAFAEVEKNQFSSAAVILGLTPTLLVLLGPQISEVALLSSRRPLLSLLINLGSLALFPGRLLKYDNPRSILPEYGSAELSLARLSSRAAAALALGQCILVIAAVVNVMELIVELSRYAVISFDCTSQGYPSMWWGSLFLIHAFVVLPRITRRERAKSSLNDAEETAPSLTPKQGSLSRRALRALKRRILAEFLPCANQSTIVLSEPSITSKACNSIVGAMCFAHLIFGTIVLSSSLLLQVPDAMFCLARFVGSTLTCRLVLMVEIAGMNGVEPS